MSKEQHNNSSNNQFTKDSNVNSSLSGTKDDCLKTPSKKKQEIKHDQVFWSLSPFPIPPKISNQHTAISQSTNVLNDGLKVIQTPYNCSYTIYRNSEMEDINDQLRPITSKIEWDKTPVKNQNQSSYYEEESQSQLISSIIPQQNEGKQAYSEEQLSQKNIIGNNINQRNQKSSILKQKQFQKRIFSNKKTNNSLVMPQINSLGKKVFCNCKKTKCLKLYCDCFRINQTCEGCNCVGCHNLEQYADERNTAILILMDRNPDPFSQKIEDDKHLKGCNCKKSFCLKKYCECYQAGLKCGQNCKCDECKNGGGSQKRQRDRIQRQSGLVIIAQQQK